MEKKEFAVKFMAGMFFIVGVLAVFGFIFLLGKDKGFSQPKFQVHVLYNNVGGLIEGAPVLLAGVNVGSVDMIDILEKEIQGHRVLVTLDILSRYKKQLAKSTNFAVKTEGILGEKLIEIDIIEGVAAKDITQPVIGEDPLDVQDLAEVFTKAAESFTRTSDQLSQIDIVELTKVMEESSRALLLTSEGINAILDQLEEAAVKSRRILDRLEQRVIDGSLFSLF